MGLILGLATGDTRTAVKAALRGVHALALVNSWPFLEKIVRERPVSGAVIDAGSVPCRALERLRTHFPGLGMVCLADNARSPATLFQLGQVELPAVEVVDVAHIAEELLPALDRALHACPARRVEARLRGRFPWWNVARIVEAIENGHCSWTVPKMQRAAEVDRPELAQRFTEWGLPKPGRILAWTRVFRAAHWLVDPGRSVESVSRQLDYHDGPAFRKAVRARLSMRPGDVVEAGGVDFALERFLSECGPEGVG